jgi:hypothetical protein
VAASSVMFDWIISRIETPKWGNEGSIFDVVYMLQPLACTLTILEIRMTANGYQVAKCLLHGESEEATKEGLGLVTHYMGITALEPSADIYSDDNSLNNLPPLSVGNYGVELGKLADYNPTLEEALTLAYICWWTPMELSMGTLTEMSEMVTRAGATLFFLEPPFQCFNNVELSCDIQFSLQVPNYRTFQKVISALENYLGSNDWIWLPTRQSSLNWSKVSESTQVAPITLPVLYALTTKYVVINRQKGFA